MLKLMKVVGLTLLLLFALVSTCVRMTLPYLGKQEIEKILSHQFNLDVTLENFKASWTEGDPVFRLEKLTLQDPVTKKTQVVIDTAYAKLNFLKSLYRLRPEFKMLELSGLNLVVHETLKGDFNIPELRWLLTQNQVVLTNSTLVWQKEDGTTLPFYINQLSLLPKKQVEITADVLLKTKKTVPLLFYAKLQKPARNWNQLTGSWYFKSGDLSIIDSEAIFGVSLLTFPFSVLEGTFRAELWGNIDAGTVTALGHAKLNQVKLKLNDEVAKPLEITEADANLILDKKQGITELAMHLNTLKINRAEWPTRYIHLLHDSKWQLYIDQFDSKYLELGGIFPIQAGLLKNIWLEQEDSADMSRVHCSLQATDVQLSFPKLFRSSQKIDVLTGTLEWKENENGWEIYVPEVYFKNPDGEVWTELSIKDSYLDNQSPFLSLLSTFKNLNGTHHTQYLPAHRMPSETVEWLDKSIKKINVESGSMVIHGPMQDFPFTHHTGHFEVEANIRDVQLDYAKGWPSIQNSTGTLRFEGNSMEILLKKGFLSHTKIQNLVGRIPDFSETPVWLQIQGKTEGEGDDALRILTKSPLFSMQTPLPITLTGKLNVDLGLVIALNTDVDTQVSGTLQFNENTLTLKSMNQSISKLKGTLEFTEKSVQSQNLTGVVFNQPQYFEITTGKKSPVVEVKTQGTIPISWLSKAIQGQTDYTATFRMLGGMRQPKAGAEFELTSNLQGIAINLPEPLRKTKNQAKPLSIKIRDSLQATFNKTNFLNTSWPWDETAPLQLTFSELNLADWLDGSAGNATLPKLEIHTPRLYAAGFAFPNTILELDSDKKAWRLALRGDAITGQINIPQEGINTPIVVELQKLELNSALQTPPKKISPTDIPAFSLQAKQVRYDQKELGDVELELLSEPNGILIKKLNLNHRALHAALTGRWIREGQNEQTHLQGNLESSNFEEFLKTWDFAPSIQSNKAQAEINLNWNGSPADVELKNMRGDLEIELSKGSLLNIEPGGANRLFGLLSLNTLARRLTLDFSDLYKKGLSFDTIRGNFRLEDGNAYTCDTELRGPSTRMVLQGRTGLVAKDYEQVASVSAKLTDTVPSVIVGIINPIAGAATWFGSQILEKQLDNVTSVGYEITGSWDKPTVKQVTFPQALQPWKIIPKLIPFFPTGQSKNLSKFCQPSG